MSSWLYNKLRLGTKRAAAIAADAETPPPPPPPCTPNRASYYVPSRDRALPCRLAGSRETTDERAAGRNPRRLRDTRFPQQQPGDIVLDRLKAKPPTTTPPPELRLRPILTRVSVSDGAARARPRSHARAPRPRRMKKAAGEDDEEEKNKKPLRWVYERHGCVVVVKESADPEEDFLASMAEMVAANYEDAAVLRGLQDLLACYLALNDAQHHRAIVAAFRRAWTMHLPAHYAMHA